jgi:hypothetical protein
MVQIATGPGALRNLFAALTEHTFQVEYGVADPPLVDYLSEMLLRFTRQDIIFKVRDVLGRRLEEVADMLVEAEQREACPKREVHRHIGDFTLFWTGVYPEALKQFKHMDRKDALLNYQEQGKRSYYIASTFQDDPYREEAAVLRRLSEQFELCSEGLLHVRREWEAMAKSAEGSAGSGS